MYNKLVFSTFGDLDLINQIFIPLKVTRLFVVFEDGEWISKSSINLINY
jgi:hypothetical protein